MGALMRMHAGTWLAYSAWFLLLWALGPVCFGFSAEAVFSYYDVEHYQTIATQGYGNWLTAFFPGFPLFWKALGVVWWVGVVNALLAASALTGLAHAWDMNRWERALLGAAPLAVFWLLPYSESLCLLGLAAGWIGVKQQRPYLMGGGVLLACFCRPLWPVLAVALLLLEVLPAWRGTAGMGPKRWYALGGMALGTLAALSTHAGYTGEWGTFHQAQAHWGNALGWPQLPFSTWSDAPVMMVDSAALMLGAMAGTRIVLQRFGGEASAATQLSLYYLSGIVALTLAFRGGELFSLGRFVWALPFASLLLIECGRSTWSWKQHGGYLVWLPAGALMCGAYLHVQSLGTFLPVMALALLVFWWGSRSQKRPWHHLALLLALVGIQLYYAIRAWSGHWVG